MHIIADGTDVIFSFVGFSIEGAILILPSFIAHRRRHKYRDALIIANFFILALGVGFTVQGYDLHIHGHDDAPQMWGIAIPIIWAVLIIWAMMSPGTEID